MGAKATFIAIDDMVVLTGASGSVGLRHVSPPGGLPERNRLAKLVFAASTKHCEPSGRDLSLAACVARAMADSQGHEIICLALSARVVGPQVSTMGGSCSCPRWDRNTGRGASWRRVRVVGPRVVFCGVVRWPPTHRLQGATFQMERAACSMQNPRGAVPTATPSTSDRPAKPTFEVISPPTLNHLYLAAPTNHPQRMALTLRLVGDQHDEPFVVPKGGSETPQVDQIFDALELPHFVGHLILGETLEEGGPDGSSSEVPGGVPS